MFHKLKKLTQIHSYNKNKKCKFCVSRIMCTKNKINSNLNTRKAQTFQALSTAYLSFTNHQQFNAQMPHQFSAHLLIDLLSGVFKITCSKFRYVNMYYIIDSQRHRFTNLFFLKVVWIERPLLLVRISRALCLNIFCLI